MTYATSAHTAFERLGHEVTAIGEGHANTIETIRQRGYDILIDLDNGRNRKGELGFCVPGNKIQIPSAVWFVDSHGQFGDLHQQWASKYTHVFYAVWNERNRFSGHKSAHWCPNATDAEFFNDKIVTKNFDFGFYGSKGGLDRTTSMKAICDAHKWTYDVRQINGAFKHRWPFTAEAMHNCHNLFNMGQKHDGPNLRVMESMAVCRPLLTEIDPLNGMDKLFVEGKHYFGYKAYSLDGMEEKMKYMMDMSNGKGVQLVACNAYDEVMLKHQIKNRVQQMLEVFNAKKAQTSSSNSKYER